MTVDTRRPPDTVRAEVMMSRLQEIRAAGASTVTVDGGLPGSDLRLLVSGSNRVAANLGLDRAEATVSGSSRLELSGTAKALSVQGSGASRLELADLRLQTLDITLSGASRQRPGAADHRRPGVRGLFADQPPSVPTPWLL
jgi:hypothetical protein